MQWQLNSPKSSKKTLAVEKHLLIPTSSPMKAMHKESAQASQCIHLRAHIGMDVDSENNSLELHVRLCLREQCDLASGRMGRCNAPLGSDVFYLPCVSWFRQSRSTQSTGIWPADSASSCPLWIRSHGNTRLDSWQNTHSSSSVFQRWNMLNWSHEENYPPIVPFCQAMRGRRCVPYTCVERFSISSLHKYVILGDNYARKLVVKLSTLWYCIFQVGCFNGRQWNSTEPVGDAILAILNDDWQMSCSPWFWLANARVISVKVPPPFENFAIWLAGTSACLCSKTCTPHARVRLAAVGPRVGPSVLVGYVIQVENTRSTCLPALKLWNWKSVLSWVWKCLARVYGELRADFK